MKVLYTAFNGKSNSSKILLDNIIAEKNNKLYLRNSFKTSVEQLNKKIKNNEYDLIISFGQAPLDKETIKIETRGNGIVPFDSDYDYKELERIFNKNNFKTIISNDAGNYSDGIPKENFQANHPIVGAEVYQYGENIVVEIGGKY